MWCVDCCTCSCHTVAERMRILLCVILWYNIVIDETFCNTKIEVYLSPDVPLLNKKIIILPVIFINITLLLLKQSNLLYLFYFFQMESRIKRLVNLAFTTEKSNIPVVGISAGTCLCIEPLKNYLVGKFLRHRMAELNTYLHTL